MRKSILILMVCCVAAFALACSPSNNAAPADKGAADKGAADKGAADKGKDGGGAAVDAFAIWKKKGNFWTTKSTTKMAGNETVSYTKMEVTDWKDDEATYTMSTMDKDMKETFAQKDQKMKTKVEAPAKDAPKVEAPKTTEEEVECKAWGKVKAQKTEANGATTWTVGGVMVKMHMKNDNMETTTELWETNLAKP